MTAKLKNVTSRSMASLMVLSVLLLAVTAISCVSFIDGGPNKSIIAFSGLTLEKSLPSGQHLYPEKISDNCSACKFEELINKRVKENRRPVTPDNASLFRSYTAVVKDPREKTTSLASVIPQYSIHSSLFAQKTSLLV